MSATQQSYPLAEVTPSRGALRCGAALLDRLVTADAAPPQCLVGLLLEPLTALPVPQADSRSPPSVDLAQPGSSMGGAYEAPPALLVGEEPSPAAFVAEDRLAASPHTAELPPIASPPRAEPPFREAGAISSARHMAPFYRTDVAFRQRAGRFDEGLREKS